MPILNFYNLQSEELKRLFVMLQNKENPENTTKYFP